MAPRPQHNSHWHIHWRHACLGGVLQPRASSHHSRLVPATVLLRFQSQQSSCCTIAITTLMVAAFALSNVWFSAQFLHTLPALLSEHAVMHVCLVLQAMGPALSAASGQSWCCLMEQWSVGTAQAVCSFGTASTARSCKHSASTRLMSWQLLPPPMATPSLQLALMFRYKHVTTFHWWHLAVKAVCCCLRGFGDCMSALYISLTGSAVP